MLVLVCLILNIVYLDSLIKLKSLIRMIKNKSKTCNGHRLSLFIMCVDLLDVFDLTLLVGKDHLVLHFAAF